VDRLVRVDVARCFRTDYFSAALRQARGPRPVYELASIQIHDLRRAGRSQDGLTRTGWEGWEVPRPGSRPGGPPPSLLAPPGPPRGAAAVTVTTGSGSTAPTTGPTGLPPGASREEIDNKAKKGRPLTCAMMAALQARAPRVPLRPSYGATSAIIGDLTGRRTVGSAAAPTETHLDLIHPERHAAPPPPDLAAAPEAVPGGTTADLRGLEDLRMQLQGIRKVPPREEKRGAAGAVHLRGSTAGSLRDALARIDSGASRASSFGSTAPPHGRFLSPAPSVSAAEGERVERDAKAHLKKRDPKSDPNPDLGMPQPFPPPPDRFLELERQREEARRAAEAPPDETDLLRGRSSGTTTSSRSVLHARAPAAPSRFAGAPGGGAVTAPPPPPPPPPPPVPASSALPAVTPIGWGLRAPDATDRSLDLTLPVGGAGKMGRLGQIGALARQIENEGGAGVG